MDLQETRLENGLTIVSERIPHLKSAALGVWVNAGSRQEKDVQHGLAHLLEHMAFKGTKKRTARDIAEEIEAVGGELNAATSVENTAYYARILSEDVPLALNILADILQNAVLEEEELAKEKHVILQEIGASLDMPEDLVFDRFQETAFPGQPIGRPILGTEETVLGFDGAAIRDYLSTHYFGENMVVAAAGDIDHVRFVEWVKNEFSAVKPGSQSASAPALYHGGDCIEVRDLQEAQIIIGFEGLSHANEDYFAIQLLAAVLGGGMSSRLFQEVREKHGLCYSVYAFHWAFSDTGIFGIHAATGGEDVAKLIPVLLQELRAICASLERSELDRARAQIRAGLLMSLESPASRTMQIARHMLLFGRCMSPEEQIERLDKVSVHDICRVAKTVFTQSRPTVSAIGPVSDLIGSQEIAEQLKFAQAAE